MQRKRRQTMREKRLHTSGQWMDEDPLCRRGGRGLVQRREPAGWTE